MKLIFTAILGCVLFSTNAWAEKPMENKIQQTKSKSKKNTNKIDKYYKIDNHCCKYKKKCKEKNKGVDEYEKQK